MKHLFIRNNQIIPIIDNQVLPVLGAVTVSSDIFVEEMGIWNDPDIRGNYQFVVCDKRPLQIDKIDFQP